MNDTLGFHLYDKWLSNLRKGKKITQFFEDNLYTNIAIYGFGLIGNQMVEELKGTCIEISYLIDKRSNELRETEYTVIHPDEIKELTGVQAIIVTPFDIYLEIERNLKLRIHDNDIDIFSISNIVEYVSMYGKNKY